MKRFGLFLLLLCGLARPLRALSDAMRKKNYTQLQLLDMLKEDCGEVCDTSIEGIPGDPYPVIEKDFDCDVLFSSPLLDPDDIESIVPFDEVPKEIRDMFTYGDRMPFGGYNFDDSPKTKKEFGFHGQLYSWDRHSFKMLRRQFRTGTMRGGYGYRNTDQISGALRDHMGHLIDGGHVLVIGSQAPWIEAILVELGARHVTTLEYSKVDNENEQLTVLLPEDFKRLWEDNGRRPVFDAVVTFSSVEHSGLGRYGDGLNPWGDLIAVARAWCLTKPRGRMLMGVPTGYDAILFNACRLYGPLMYSHLFANWKVVHTEAEMFRDGADTKKEDWPGGIKDVWGYQPVHVVEKKEFGCGEVEKP